MARDLNTNNNMAISNSYGFDMDMGDDSNMNNAYG